MFLETARSKSRSRAPPAASGAFATWQAAGGRAPPATSPERWGRSWASRPSRCAVAARALTPHPSDSAPQAPARASGAFSSGGRVKGLVRPAARRARTRPLDATGRPKPAGRVSGRSSPGTPCPSSERPRQGRRRRLRRAVQGAPPRGFKGAQPPWAAQRTKNPLPKASIFCSSSFALRLFTAPRRGLNLETEGGTPESHE